MLTLPKLSSLPLLAALLANGGCGDDEASPEAGETSSTTGSSSGSTTGSTSGPATETTTGPGSESSTSEVTSSSSSSSSGPPPETDTAEESSSSTGEPIEPPEPLPWSDACMIGPVDVGVLHPRLECTAAEVPLDWQDPDGETIPIAAFRVRTEAAQRHGTMWLLDGGPGGSGLGFLASAARYNDAGWDVVVPSHRGTVSPQLRCINSTYSQACRDELNAEWGTGLQHFNTVNAAHDVGELIDRASVDETGNTVVYGVSYGSFWGHHYLGLHPTQADGVILDSVLRAGVDVVGQLLLDHERAEDLLQRCVDDPACGPSLPHASGQIFATNLAETWNAFDCGSADIGQWSDSSIRNSLGNLVNRPTRRNYLPLLAAMFAQCDPQLTQLASNAINLIAANVASPSGAATPTGQTQLTWGRPAIDPTPFGLPGDLFYSDVVFGVVAGTSVIPEGSDANGAVAASNDYLVTIGLGELVATASNTFGDLPNPPFSANFAAQTPTLILNARYDLQTPLAWSQEAADLLGVELYVFEDGSHSLASPGQGGKTPDGMPCANAMIFEFAENPGQAPDASCIDDLLDIDVSLQRPDLQAVSLAVFGTTDPWSLVP